MNRENYKSKRTQPKRTSTVSKAKVQMLRKPKILTTDSAKKLREIYSRKTEWTTKVIPKLREK
jgi:hypothetical protein